MKFKTSGKIILIGIGLVTIFLGKVFVYDKMYPSNISENSTKDSVATTAIETVSGIVTQNDTVVNSPVITPTVTVSENKIAENKTVKEKSPKKKDLVASSKPKVPKNSTKEKVQAKEVSNNVIPNF